MTSKTLILIPARYASTRFEGKPLAKIGNKTMIQRVYENVSNLPHCHTVVVTDDSRIENHLLDIKANVVRVDDDFPSGSERIYAAYERFFSHENIDFIINVQGDEPLLKGDEVLKLREYHQHSSFDIATIVKPYPVRDDLFADSSKVKVAYEPTTGRCLYFSRSGIPFDRDLKGEGWFLHVGIYSYRPSALKTFCKASPSYVEQVEKLEQLRAQSLGFSIGAIASNVELIGVDTPHDLERVKGVLI